MKDHGYITLSNWQYYVDGLNILQKYPGINGMGIIDNVPASQMQNYLSKYQRERKDFTIHPKHNNKKFFPIRYIVPVETNAKAVGLDIAFEDNRLTAALNAEKTGQAQLTGPITLVQDKEQTPGFLLFVPFYAKDNLKTQEERQEHFLGMVYAPFIMKNLMNGTLAPQNRDIAIKITDKNSILFNELTPDSNKFSKDPKYTEHRAVKIYGRTWKFQLENSNSFFKTINQNQPKSTNDNFIWWDNY